jgi:glyoxylase-like metal-dependent hydrolase (beta-lactamase superfamily II)
MFIKGFAAGPWQTNAYVVAPGPRSECLIIDPGQGSVAGLAQIIEQNALRPVAALVTHGHIDHMWSLFPLCSGYQIPGLIHRADRHLLRDPLSAISPETKRALQSLLTAEDVFSEPEELIEVEQDITLEIAGLSLRTIHAPGHTAGSTMFEFDGTQLFSGDVLFAGAIGRTDLPGGSATAMNQTLAQVILPLADDLQVFPGHGPKTTIGHERISNPYLIRTAQGGSAL